MHEVTDRSSRDTDLINSPASTVAARCIFIMARSWGTLTWRNCAMMNQIGRVNSTRTIIITISVDYNLKKGGELSRFGSSLSHLMCRIYLLTETTHVKADGDDVTCCQRTISGRG